MDENLLTIKEIAKIMNIAVSTAYEVARRTDFPAVRINNLVRVSKADLFAWIEMQKNRGEKIEQNHDHS